MGWEGGQWVGEKEGDGWVGEREGGREGGGWGGASITLPPTHMPTSLSPSLPPTHWFLGLLGKLYSTFYFNIGKHAQIHTFLLHDHPILGREATAFYYHKLLQTPYLYYKLIHKQYHCYHSPTPYSRVAMSPFEMLCLQGLFIIPVSTVLIHAFVFFAIEMYGYEMMDHSGIKMEALWPWEPNTKFHDGHHR